MLFTVSEARPSPFLMASSKLLGDSQVISMILATLIVRSFAEKLDSPRNRRTSAATAQKCHTLLVCGLHF
jgi:hypothetical protein